MITSMNHITLSVKDIEKLEIHVGNWRKRIEAKKADVGHWKNVQWFV